VRRAALAFAMIGAGACAGARAAGPNELVVRGVAYPDATTAKVGARFSASPAAQCEYGDGRASQWATTGARVTAGALPPGLSLDEGVIVGKPTAPGDYHATITFHGVVCGGKPFPDQQTDVHLVVKPR
jgi:hypothetical protein